MNKQILIILLIGINLFLMGFVHASDWSVFQGQYYIGDEFQVGTYEFEFNVYDSEAGGNLVFSYTCMCFSLCFSRSIRCERICNRTCSRCSCPR